MYCVNVSINVKRIRRKMSMRILCIQVAAYPYLKAVLWLGNTVCECRMKGVI